MARAIDTIDRTTIQHFACGLATEPIRASHDSSATVSWTNGMLRRVDPNVQRALDAIETADRLVAANGGHFSRGSGTAAVRPGSRVLREPLWMSHGRWGHTLSNAMHVTIDD